MDKKTDLRIIKTKKSLFQGLTHLMKGKKFEKIKVSDICAASLVNRSTFYDHFSDKYELLTELIENLRTELNSKLQNNIKYKTTREYYLNCVRLYLEHINNYIDVYSSILKNNSEGMLMSITYYTIETNLKKILKDTLKDEPIPIDILSKFYVSAVINVCTEYIKNPDKYNIDDFVEYINKLLPTKFD